MIFAAWIEYEGETDSEASEGESDSETSSESHTSSCSNRSNKSDQTKPTCNIEDGECTFYLVKNLSLTCLCFENLPFSGFALNPQERGDIFSWTKVCVVFFSKFCEIFCCLLQRAKTY